MQIECKKCATKKPIDAFQKVTSYYRDKIYINHSKVCRDCISAAKRFTRKGTIEYTYPKEKKTNISKKELQRCQSPIPWQTLKGKTTLENYKEYPFCSCGRKYIPQLGCLLCTRVLLTNPHN